VHDEWASASTSQFEFELIPVTKNAGSSSNADDDVPGGGAASARPDRMDEGCAGAEDIAIVQSHASLLPSGVPAYKVTVTNQCLGDCAIADIHLRCGWFSSVELVDPATFRRLRHNDCLLNDGRPLLAGETISFQYANSFPYPLSVTVATCVDPNTVGP
jgi:hypothetical protein